MSIVLDPVNGITQATWTTAGRPVSPSAGQVGFNTSLNALEQYTGTSWETIPTWSTANRPVSPVAGYSGYNTDTKAFEFYNGTSWIGFNQSNLSTPISYLLIAGGGAGGSLGGGGAGGYLSGTSTLYPAVSYTVTIGGGGTGVSGQTGAAGSNTSISGSGFTTVTATGGGGGGGDTPATTATSGGSGGGGGAYVSTPSAGGGGGGGSSAVGTNAGTTNGWAGASGTPGQGYAGGTGGISTSTAGNGGNGTASSISGTSTTYAGGGGGGAYIFGSSGTAGTGGTGGGGNGGRNGLTATSGTTNTGSGGGAAGYNSSGGFQGTQGSGASGIAYISYPGSQAFTGGLITSSGGNTIHTFTSSGTLTPISGVLNLNNSLRFRASASAYLNRTPSVAGNQQKFTISFWVKRGLISSVQRLINCVPGSTDSTYFSLLFQSNDQLSLGLWNGSVTTTQVFRDPSAWYHIVVAVDTTQAVSSNRMILYVNGSQVSSLSASYYPTQNTNLAYNSANAHLIGQQASAAYFDGYLTNFYSIDGQALTPSYFGNTDAYGNWKPITYVGSYGQNGFFLNFSNAASTTTIGYDYSGNSNNWTANNISVTAGTTYDSMTDVPTLTSATAANYAVLNPLKVSSNAATISNANLNVVFSAGSNTRRQGTIAVSSGKYYFEVLVNALGGTYPAIGVMLASTSDMNTYVGAESGTLGYYSNGGVNGGGGGRTYSTYTANDIIGVAIDCDTSRVTFYKNGANAVTSGTTYESITAGETYVAAISGYSSANLDINFGQRPFSYSAPSGHVALNTYNLTTPTILQGNLYMDATLYTGTNTTNNIVNQAGFKPDLAWLKVRSTSSNHVLINSITGVTAYLNSNTTGAEQSSSDQFTSFNSNGFTLGPNITGGNTNTNGSTYVGWQWQAGQGTTSSNTQGSITSTTSVNATAGFSIVTYTGNATSGATVGHGLGVAPKFIIVKSRSAVVQWVVYTASLGVQYFLGLNNTATADNTLANYWSSSAPTSTVFGLGSYGGNNASGGTYVAYCWAAISGFSAFGSYTGGNNTGAASGQANGPFIYLGFRPKFVLIKRTSSAADWEIYDSSRGTYNANYPWLQPNLSNAEASTEAVDFLSNGFKIRSESGATMYPDGATFIYAAFAENPFKYANAR